MKWVALLLLMLVISTAQAGSGKSTKPENVVWKEECGSCHLAYPPEMLSSESWQQLMGRLDKHFGANAVLDAKDGKLIQDFLVRNAGRGVLYSSASSRISDTPWFKHEHRSVSAKEWVNPQVESVSNCLACHGNGGHVLWSEHDIQIDGTKVQKNHKHG
jgi:cytochrome c553